MKKIIIALVTLVAIQLNAASFEENIVNLIKNEVKTDVKVISSNNLKGNKDLKFAVIEIVNNSQRIPIFATKDGKMIIGLSNILFISNKDDEKMINDTNKKLMEYNETSQQVAAEKLINQLKPEQYITLKSSAKNPTTTFIVADPNCGYCKEEFRNIDNRLKTSDVNIVLVGILGQDSINKAAYGMSTIKSSMSEKDKLNALKEIFSNNFKAPNNVDTTAVKATTDFLFKNGVIRGTPFIYEKK